MRIRPTGLLIVIATCVLMPAQVGLARTMVSGLDDATLTVPGGTTDFPPGYEDYHTYAEMMADITANCISRSSQNMCVEHFIVRRISPEIISQ